MLLPLLFGLIAGFPSPAANFMESEIDILKLIIKNPCTTYFGRVSGNSMEGVHIHDGDIIVVDKSRDSKNGDIAVCFLDGELLAKRVYTKDHQCWLMAENPKYAPIEITAANDFQVWAVVISVVKMF